MSSNQSVRVTDSASGNVYEFVPASLTYDQAELEATQKSLDGIAGKLLSIDSLDELQFLETLLPYTTGDTSNLIKDGEFPRGRFWTENSETDALKYFTNSWDTSSLSELQGALHPDSLTHYIVEYEQPDQAGEPIEPSQVPVESEAVQDSDGSFSPPAGFVDLEPVVIPGAETPVGTHSLTLIADVFGTIVYLKDLTEVVTADSHIIYHAGTAFEYSEVDPIIMTVVRNGNFTDEFTDEIADVYPTYAGVSFNTAVALVGQFNIDETLLSVAVADGNYVG